MNNILAQLFSDCLHCAEHTKFESDTNTQPENQHKNNMKTTITINKSYEFITNLVIALAFPFRIRYSAPFILILATLNTSNKSTHNMQKLKQ